MLSLIPEIHRDTIGDAVRSTFGCAAVEALEPLAGGMSSALLYRLRVRGRDHALRAETPAHAMIDPARHFAALRVAAEAGIAPPVLHADPATGVMITDFIVQRPLREYAGSRADLMREAAYLARTLQATSPLPAGIAHLDAAERFIADFQATGLLSRDAIGEHLFRFSQMREAWPTDVAPVSSHNDLNPGNILYDGGRLWFVDWAVAAGNDPFGDPACLANTLGADEAHEMVLITAWLGRAPDAREVARFHLMRLVWPMVQAMGILTVVARDRPDLRSGSPVLLARSLAQVHADIGAGRLDMTTAEGRLEYGKSLLDDLLVKLRAPRFGDALRLLAG